MATLTHRIDSSAPYPVDIDAMPALEDRDRLTTAFRIILAIPHLLLVGGPLAVTFSWTWSMQENGPTWSASGGVLGAVAFVAALISWFSIVATGAQPQGLWKLAAFYLRWRVRAVAYTSLLRDEYPPFGEGEYPFTLHLEAPERPRDRLAVAFRPVLVIPHLVVIWILGVAWAVTTVAAWFSILITGRYPAGLYQFGVGVLRWTVRVESYALLLRDEYPPFSLN